MNFLRSASIFVRETLEKFAQRRPGPLTMKALVERYCLKQYLPY